jgi:hypothetical protein
MQPKGGVVRRTMGYSVTIVCACVQYHGGGREQARDRRSALTGPSASDAARYSMVISRP